MILWHLTFAVMTTSAPNLRLSGLAVPSAYISYQTKHTKVLSAH